MALKDCIGKAGKALDRDDADGMLSLVDQGVSEADAVTQQIAAVEQELADLRQRALAAGAKEVPAEPRVLEQTVETDPLVVLHNLSAENLLFADKLGGIPVPSLGITKADTPFDAFGEISLIGRSGMVDPRSGVPVFSADAYTQRFPDVIWSAVPSKKANQFIAQFGEDYKQRDTGEVFDSLVNRPDRDKAIEEARRSATFMRAWLVEQGDTPAANVSEKISAPQKAAWAGMPAWLDTVKALRDRGVNLYDLNDQSPEWDELSEAARLAGEQYIAQGNGPRLREMFAELVADSFDESGRLTFGAGDRAIGFAARSSQPASIDKYATRTALEKQIGDRMPEFQQWAADKIAPLFSEPKIKVRGRKVPMTLENIVEAMASTKVVGKEKTMTVSGGQVSAANAKRYQTLDEIKADRERIVSPDVEREAIKTSDKALEDYRTAALQFFTEKDYRGQVDTWRGLDMAMQSLKDAAKKAATPAAIRAAMQRNGFTGVDDATAELGAKALQAVRQTVTDYFEAKPQRAVSLSEFAGAVIPAKAGANVRAVLDRAGVPYVEYDGTQEGRQKAVARFSREVNADTSDVLFQRPEQEQPRGRIKLFPDGRRVIELGQASDLSTFLHESAHLFLDLEAQLAAEFGVTEQQQRILDWLGVATFEEITVDHHEQWAETFEAYLREGKAPSVGLRQAFAAFSRWLTTIYKTLMGLPNNKLDAEVRAIFDRLLATQEEIDRAAGNPIYDQFFRSREQAGMTDAEWQKYQEKRAKVKQSATVTLQDKALKQYRKMREDEWNTERAPLVDEEMERLGKQPVYEVIKDISSGYPMDWDATLEVLGADKPTGRLIGKLKKGGVDPAEYAEQYGYPNTRAMLDEILAAPSLKAAATAAAQVRMIEKYGDILNDGTIEQEARDALHNEAQADLLLDEINALDRAPANRVDREYLRTEAVRLIGGLTYREITPERYYQAEIRAARKAATARTPQEKRVAKVQQLANHYLYKEATRVRQEMEKQRRYVRSVQTRQYDTKEVEPQYAQAMRVLANFYELRTKDPNRVPQLDAYLNWHQTQLSDPNGFVASMLTMYDPYLIAALEAKRQGQPISYEIPTFEEMTADQVRGVYEHLRHLRFVGGSMSEQGRAEFNADKASLANSIDTNGGRDVRPADVVAPPPSRLDKLTDSLKQLGFSLVNLRNLSRRLDGFNEDGEAYRLLYRLIEDAENVKLQAQRDLYDKYKQEMEGINRVGLNRNEITITTDDGRQWTTDGNQRLMLALYWGSESSREAIREGQGVTDNDVLRVLSTMTPDQLQLVNAIWKINESLWPSLSAAAVRMYGVAPPKLEALPYTINGVTLTGGHMRLYYHSLTDEMKEVQDQGGKFMSIMPSRAGSTIARVGSGGKPVLLDRSNITRAYNDALHFIAYAEPARRLAGLVNSGDVKGAIVRKHGEAMYKSLVENLEGITSNRNEREAIKFFADLSRHIRKMATLRHLAYSIRNALQGLSSIKIAMDEAGAARLMAAYARVVTSPRETIRTINDLSVVMRNRGSLVNRESAEFLREMSFGGPAEAGWNTFVAAGFAPQKLIDSLIAYPVWLARYNQYAEDVAIGKMTQRDAVSKADEAVAASVGSGQDLQMGAIFQMNKPEWVKVMTAFGSWFNNYFNRLYRESKGFSGDGFKSWGFYQAALTTPMIVAVMSALIVADEPAEDEDWMSWALKRYGAFMAGLLPLVRDFVSAASGIPSRTPLAMVPETPVRLAREIKQTMEGQQSSERAVSDFLKLTGTVAPIPGLGNVTRLLDYKDSYDEGNEGPDFRFYNALVEGPDRNK